MDTVLRKQTIIIFRVPPEDANSIFLWNTANQTTCYPNLDNIMFIHHCEKLKQKTSWWFTQEKLNYKYHIMFWTNTDVGCCTLHHICIPVSTALSNETIKAYSKIKSCKPFLNAKCYQFYIYRWIYSQYIYPRYMQLPKQKWKNITTTFTTEHNK